MFGITGFIKTITDIPADHEIALDTLIIKRTLQKGEDFISEGSYPKSIGFVLSGLFRYYYIDRKGEEFTKGFFPENTVLSSYSAIIENRPSYFAIQALEESEIEVFDYHKLNERFGKAAWYKDFLLTLIQKGFIVKETREREFLLLDAEERYIKFKERFPTLENRVKQQIIASYVGITPESLSRIRKKMNLLT
jgi:CRP-like cAMP-binding protein